MFGDLFDYNLAKKAQRSHMRCHLLNLMAALSAPYSHSHDTFFRTEQVASLCTHE